MVLAVIDPGSPALLDARTERELTGRVGVAEANRLCAALLQVRDDAAGKAARRTVQLGRRGGLEAVVEKRLEPGEKVIVHPGDTLRDGLRIKLKAGV
ncbi:hypothetical protein SCD_n02092 [Sulfuricella denitrificans skB26]|uniref:Uncharacterized protein n=1 Tax=Sulfuricella denitrificans (strain DSM 22764 / NBRC 105220 / skB26) TaxID=1163617 RepID=S6ACV5_SULDS|nr:hypothetical protein [Sulfuricella denitrificans]BAN35903.1 hypothetical protein SCD_n02092 [Sulfuricella denitrificans skB26]